MKLKIIPYKLYVFASASLSDSKAFGAIGDVLRRLLARDGLRASRAFFEKNAGRAAHVASFLADEKSREAYLSLIKYRCSRERRYINPHMQKKKTAYFDKELILPAEEEIFADVGAFQGHTSLRFQAFCVAAGRPAPRCVLFEPDPFNFSLLQKSLPSFIKTPVCMQIGLGHERGRYKFVPGKFSMSKIDPSGRGVIEVDTLDHALGGMPVSYIKIDVEGADLDALRGARETILNYRPRIAAAIYHSDGHMLDIPEFLHELCPEYRFYVRHYSCNEGETILYAIPAAGSAPCF